MKSLKPIIFLLIIAMGCSSPEENNYNEYQGVWKRIGTIKYEKDEKDTRVKHIFLTQNGKELFDEIFTVQKKRLYEAFRNSRSDEVLNFDKVLKKIINE